MDEQIAVAWDLHARRQLEVHRGNLLSVLSYCVKSLIDQSCFNPIDDSNYALHNFCAVVEQILTHRLKPQTSFFSGIEVPTFWDYIRLACKTVPHNCLSSIEAMEHLQTSLGKGRAWIRMALVEKRLSEYLTVALSNRKVTGQFYEVSAIVRSEEGGTMTMLTQGLNAIDFSLCLRDGSFDIGNYLAIDYTPFLAFSQSDTGRAADAVEERVAAMESSGHPVSENDAAMTLKRQYSVEGMDAVARVATLEQQLRKEKEQKSFFEELLRNREGQLCEYKQQVEELKQQLNESQQESAEERKQYQAIILELQDKLSSSPAVHCPPAISPQRLTYSIQYDLSPAASPPSSPAVNIRQPNGGGGHDRGTDHNEEQKLLGDESETRANDS